MDMTWVIRTIRRDTVTNLVQRVQLSSSSRSALLSNSCSDLCLYSFSFWWYRSASWARALPSDTSISSRSILLDFTLSSSTSSKNKINLTHIVYKWIFPFNRVLRSIGFFWKWWLNRILLERRKWGWKRLFINKCLFTTWVTVVVV